jgi:transposase InsO family protein
VERQGQDWIGPELGVPARTVSRILRRHQVSYLRELDPLTGEMIRVSKTTALRYERDKPGDPVHMDVKKLGRIPDGGGWKTHGRQMGSTGAKKRANIGFDYIHSVVDDHTRLVYFEIRPDEKGATVTVREVMTDNHWSYTRTVTFTELLKDGKIKHRRIRPHCPWHNGKVERFNRTLQTEWAYRQVFASNQDRHDALAPWLDNYNTSRRHSALGEHPPINRLSPT